MLTLREPRADRVGHRLRNLPFIARASFRSTPLLKVAGGPALALAFLALMRVQDTEDYLGPGLLVAVLTAVGAGFALDDPAANTLAPSPASLRTRRGVSAGLAAVVLGVGWSAQLLILDRLAPELHDRLGGLTLEAVAFALVSLALSALISERLDEPVGGSLAAMALPGVVGLFFALTQSPLSRYPIPSPMPGEHTHRWWWVILGCVAFLAWCTRDPGRASFSRQKRSGAHPEVDAATPLAS